MALITNIALGLLGLGIVVFVHELGHFIAARLVGIDVEAFSIGWGKAVLKKEIRGVEYRLGMFPVGGYCKMRGHDEIRGAVESGAGHIEPVKGTYYGATPLRRIMVCLAGPVFNFVFAIIVFSVIWGSGTEFSAVGNRVVLASERTPGASYPADEAGLMTGDTIVAINGRAINHFHQIQETVFDNQGGMLRVTVERGGRTIDDFHMEPRLVRHPGTGRNRDTIAWVIGVSPWIDPVVAAVAPDGAASVALMPGDRIVAIDGNSVENTADIGRLLGGKAASIITVDFMRGGAKLRAELVTRPEDGHSLGIAWQTLRYQRPSLSFPAAMARGVQETWRVLASVGRGFAMIFRGEINPIEAVSSPLYITYVVGDVALRGFEHSTGAGMRSLMSFLALISVAVGIMNLLPIPVLDGGQIALFTVEVIRRKPTPPKVLGIFQTVGVVLIIGLMLFALLADIDTMFLGGRLGGG